MIIPPRSTAVPSDTAETAPTQRDRHIEMIEERGRLGWQRAVNYGKRSLAEVAMFRYKKVISRSLQPRRGLWRGYQRQRPSDGIQLHRGRSLPCCIPVGRNEPAQFERPLLPESQTRRENDAGEAREAQIFVACLPFSGLLDPAAELSGLGLAP